MSRSNIRGDQIKDDSLTGDQIDESTLVLKKLSDADGDTSVNVEQNTDEDKIRFVTNSSERMIIDETGQVGIGTSSPNSHLTINGTQPKLTFRESDSDRAEISVNDSDNLLLVNQSTNKYVVFKTNDQGVIREGLRMGGPVPEVVVNEGSDSLIDFRVESDSQTHMLFVDGGNNRVGIGTDAPATTLHAYADISNAYVATVDNDQGTAGHGLKVTSDGTGAGTYLFDLESDSTTMFRVRGDGRVGIGKVSSLPASVLTVSSSNGDSDLAIAHKIHHIGDADTFIEFENNRINFNAGGNQTLSINDTSISFDDVLMTELSIPGIDLQTDTNAYRFNCPYNLTVGSLALNLDQHTTSGDVTVTVTNTTTSNTMITFSLTGTSLGGATTTVSNASAAQGDVITFAITATPANAQSLRAILGFRRDV